MADRTLTNLIPTLQTAVDTVGQELVGFIPAVDSDMSFQRAAKGQLVYSPVTVAKTPYDVTPAVDSPDTGDDAVGNEPMQITKSRAVAVRINGEQELGLGSLWNNIRADEFAQAMRALVNEVEADIGAEYLRASRAHGTAGTTPFGATPKLSDAFAVKKILDDNGAPVFDRQIVIDTNAALNLGGLTQLTNVNEAGSSDMLRQGIIGNIAGLNFRQSAQVALHTPGTAASYLVDLTAGYAVGSTDIHVDTGTGTMLAGDILTNTQSGRDSNKYVIKTGHTGGGDQDLVLANPGLRAAWVNNDPVAIGAAYRANLAFHRSAIRLATRAPAVPTEGDQATDSIIITHAASGISFEVRMYAQYRQVLFEVGLAWGVRLVKPEFCALLLG